jgi:hypothetical protein
MMVRRRRPVAVVRARASAPKLSIACPQGWGNYPYSSYGPNVRSRQRQGCLLSSWGNTQGRYTGGWCCPPSAGLGDNGAPASSFGAMLPLMAVFALTGFLMAGMSR